MTYCIGASTRPRAPGHNVYFDADELANTLFGTHLAANFIVVGAAFQAGLIPLEGREYREPPSR